MKHSQPKAASFSIPRVERVVQSEKSRRPVVICKLDYTCTCIQIERGVHVPLVISVMILVPYVRIKVHRPLAAAAAARSRMRLRNKRAFVLCKEIWSPGGQCLGGKLPFKRKCQSWKSRLTLVEVQCSFQEEL